MLPINEKLTKNQRKIANNPNIGIECEYYEADGKPILNRVVADTYKNGAKLNLGEVWSK